MGQDRTAASNLAAVTCTHAYLDVIQLTPASQCRSNTILNDVHSIWLMLPLAVSNSKRALLRGVFSHDVRGCPR